jgi:uncharacterized protein (TIGR02145 family)
MKQLTRILIQINGSLLLLISCLSASAQTPGNGVTDIDGNVYPTVIIGTQEWMASNLKTSSYNNGDPIPNVTNNVTWANLVSGAWSYYNNDNSNDLIYGKLYNWYAVDDNRQLCPTGWEIPSDEDLDTLVSFLGGGNWQGGKLKEAGTTHWNAPNTGATDQYGFTALPGGTRENGVFADMGGYFYMWSTWSNHLTNRHRWEMRATQAIFSSFNSTMADGYSCRCLKTSLSVSVTLTEESNHVAIYPNPFRNNFTIELPESTTYPITLEIVDYLGRNVHSQAIESATTKIVLDEQTAAGTYFVKVFNKTTQVVERILKTN